jgi:hypothetical protein
MKLVKFLLGFLSIAACNGDSPLLCIIFVVVLAALVAVGWRFVNWFAHQSKSVRKDLISLLRSPGGAAN